MDRKIKKKLNQKNIPYTIVYPKRCSTKSFNMTILKPEFKYIYHMYLYVHMLLISTFDEHFYLFWRGVKGDSFISICMQNLLFCKMLTEILKYHSANLIGINTLKKFLSEKKKIILEEKNSCNSKKDLLYIFKFCRMILVICDRLLRFCRYSSFHPLSWIFIFPSFRPHPFNPTS